MTPLTPAELDRAEREINANLEGWDAGHGRPVQRVCLHPDRTVTQQDEVVRVECDYCSAWSEGAFGYPVPDLMPHTYSDN